IAGLPLRFSATPPRLERAAPSLGSGNDEVLTRLLGMPEAEVHRLEAARVLCPIAPLPERYAQPGVRLERPYLPWALPLLRLPRGEGEVLVHAEGDQSEDSALLPAALEDSET